MKHPAHKLLKKPAHFLFKQPDHTIGSTLSEHETARVSELLHAIDHRKQVASIMREKVWTGTKYVGRFAEVAYYGFTLFLMYMAGLDYLTDGEVAKGGKKQ